MINSQSVNTTAQFEGLSFAEQATVIWQKGRPVATRHLPEFRLHLYAVNGFFVEMWVCRRRYVVTLFRILADTNELAPYLSTVVLDDLLPA